ncbi:MAG: LamG-like jellyroll fold domain-containing protein [Prevotella sp.]
MKKIIFTIAALALPFMGAWAQTVPTADLLDVLFHPDGSATNKVSGGMTVEHVQPAEEAGKTINVYWNSRFNRYSARSRCGQNQQISDYYKISYQDNQTIKDNLADGHTMEALVMTTAAPASCEYKFFSSHQGGGTGLMISSDGKLTFLVNTTDNNWCWGAQTADQAKTNTYYHLVGVYDKANGKSVLYVNGQKVGETNASGDFKHVTAAQSEWFALFGDPQYKNGEAVCNQSLPGDVVIARIYSNPLTESEVSALWKQVETPQPALPKADLLDVVFNGDGSAADISGNQKTVERLAHSTLTTPYNNTFGRFIANSAATWNASGDNAGCYKVDYSSDDYFKNALASGHAIEAIVRANDKGTEEAKWVSSHEGSGTGLMVSKSDYGGGTAKTNALTFLVKTKNGDDEAWRWGAQTQDWQANTYYHLVGVYDKNAGKSFLYVNGTLVGTADAPGEYVQTAEGSQWIGILADPSGSNKQCAMPGEVVIARFYSNPLDADQVAMLYNAVRVAPSDLPQADILDVVLGSNGQAWDVSPVKSNVERKGSLDEEGYHNYFSDFYGRFGNHRTAAWGQNDAKNYYKISYNGKIKQALIDGHTMEAIVRTTAEEIGNGEAKWWGSMQQRGGFGFMCENTYMDYLINTWNDKHAIGSDVQIGTSGLGRAAAYYCAEIDDEANKVTQTLTGLPNGLYCVRCQGFYYNADGSANTNSYFIANNEKVLLNTIKGEDKTKYETIRNEQLQLYKDDPEYPEFVDGYRDNSAAGEFLAQGRMYGAATDFYTSEIYVKVTDGTLALGMEKTSEAGQAFFENVQLFFAGTHEVYLSANKKSQLERDTKAYTQPVRMNLRRSFMKKDGQPAWNALVLPVSLTGDQVRQAFGNDVQLSKLEGINPNRKSQIKFNLVDLDQNGLDAGECYLIKVTKDPDVASGDTYTYEYSVDAGGNENVTVSGPIYHIEGVSQPESYFGTTTVAKDYTTDGGTLKYTGYYTKPEGGAKVGQYIEKAGTMYYLSAPYSDLYATEWTLEDPTGELAKALSFVIDEESETTGLDQVNLEGNKENYVYSLSGQIVRTNGSTTGLPKGIYIINGKKVVVD